MTASGLMDRISGGRQGMDKALFLVVVGMLSLSCKTGLWQSLHTLAWILMSVIMIRRRRWTIPGPWRWAVPWGLFAVWVVISLALGPDPSHDLYSAKKLLNVLALFLIGAVLHDSRDCLRSLVSIASVSLVLAVIGLYQFAVTADPIAHRPHGVTHHMTHSGLLMIVVCMALPLLTFRRSRADYLWWGYALVATLSLVTTLTRSAWIGLAVALAVLLLFKNPRGLLAMPVALLIVFATVPAIRNRAWSILDTRGNYSNVHRVSIYRTALRMIANHPILGVGGRHQVVLRYTDYEGVHPEPPPMADGQPGRPYETPDHLHSNLLQLAAAFGLPALLAWFAALAVWLREVLRLLPRRRDITDEPGRLYRNMILSSVTGAAGFLTMGMVEYNFGDSEVVVLFFFALSIPFILGRCREEAREFSRS